MHYNSFHLKCAVILENSYFRHQAKTLISSWFSFRIIYFLYGEAAGIFGAEATEQKQEQTVKV